MNHRKRVEWSRLDNASKIFPATYNGKDTKVFRLACELYETVDPTILQDALDITVERFPLYNSVLRRGVFWYYLETSEIRAVVDIESKPVCAPIYISGKKDLLFRVFYFNNRINLEIFHALSDGTGALKFMQHLLHHYFVLRYREAFAEKMPKLNYGTSVSKKMDDSFGRYFEGGDFFKRIKKSKNKEKRVHAYHIKGSRMDENRMNVVEGCVSVKAVLSEAHKYNTTLTIFITSLFLYSIYKDMATSGKKRPVVLSVPINLRQFFESETTRNFFSTMNVRYHFGKESLDFKYVIQRVSDVFRRDLTHERLKEQGAQLMALEKNPFARIVPLPLKDYSLRIANKVNDRGITAALSNLGSISMPVEFDAYIRQFSLITSARRPQICMCSYGDKLVVTFASPFRETEIQRTFFEFFSKNGIKVEISSNL